MLYCSISGENVFQLFYNFHVFFFKLFLCLYFPFCINLESFFQLWESFDIEIIYTLYRRAFECYLYVDRSFFRQQLDDFL